jgi:hypothetical protein
MMSEKNCFLFCQNLRMPNLALGNLFSQRIGETKSGKWNRGSNEHESRLQKQSQAKRGWVQNWGFELSYQKQKREQNARVRRHKKIEFQHERVRKANSHVHSSAPRNFFVSSFELMPLYVSNAANERTELVASQ